MRSGEVKRTGRVPGKCELGILAGTENRVRKLNMIYTGFAANLI